MARDGIDSVFSMLTGHGTLQEAPPEQPKYTKQVLKKGDNTNFPKKGDSVACFYTGTLPDGTVFDTNLGKKKPTPLKFKGDYASASH